MTVRFTDLTRPGHVRTRKRLGLALQLGGLICIALSLASGHLNRNAGPVFIIWVFLGHLVQTGAADRERLEAMERKMASLVGSPPERETRADADDPSGNPDLEPGPFFSHGGDQPVHGGYSARPILLTAGYWEEDEPTTATDADRPPGHSG